MIGSNQDCYLIPVTGKDIYGKKTYGNPIPVKCRYKEKYQLVKNNENREVLSSLEFSFGSEVEINLDMEIKLSLDGQSHQVISISPRRHLSGTVVFKKVFA